MRTRFFIAEALRSVRGNVATTLAATVTVLIVTFLLGVTITIAKYIYDYTVGVRSDVTVKLYLPAHPALPRAQLNRVANQVQALPYEKSMQYVSPAEAKAKLSPQARKEINQLPYNPLPPAFYVKLTDPEKAAQLRAAALRIGPVRNCGQAPCITYGKEITDQVLHTTKIILGFVGGLMLLLGVAAVVLIANTIRLSIFSRRREIEVMKLVGATNWFVRLPFVLEGMFTGLLGSLSALALLGLVYAALENLNSNLTDPVRSVGVVPLIVMLGAFGLLLGAVGSAMTLRRFLRV